MNKNIFGYIFALVLTVFAVFSVNAQAAPIDTTPPTASIITTANVPLTGPVVIKFNEFVNNISVIPTDSLTVSAEGTLQIIDSFNNLVAGSATFFPSTNQAVFTPNVPFDANKSYTVKIYKQNAVISDPGPPVVFDPPAVGISDSAGNMMSSQTLGTFTTTITIDTQQPTAVMTSGTTNVPLNGPIEIEFSEVMQNNANHPLTTGVGGIIQVKENVSGNIVDGSISYDTSTNLLKFIPTAPFVSGRAYTLYVLTGPVDLSNNALNTFVPALFTAVTVPVDTNLPTVSLLTTTETALNGPIVLQFSEYIASGIPLTGTVSPAGNDTITVRKTDNSDFIAGTVLFSPTTNQATFVPLAPFSGNTNYTINVSSSAQDSSGNALSPFSGSFVTTVNPDDVKPTATLQTTANVALNGPVVIQFSEYMVPGSITTSATGGIMVIDPAGNYVAGTIAFDITDNKASFSPFAPFVSNTLYTVYITTGPLDLAGNYLATFTPATFRTVTVDTTAPVAILQTTANVGSLGPVVLQISEYVTGFVDCPTMADTSPDGNFFVMDSSNNDVQGKACFDAASNQVSYVPFAPFANGATYTLKFTSGNLIKDLAGNSLAAFSPATFTATFSDAVKPIATFVSATTNVGSSDPVEIQFNEAMQPDTITTGVGGTVLVNDPLGNLVPGNISYTSITNKATFTPTAPFNLSATYRVSITSGPKDLSGNNLATFAPVSFTITAATHAVTLSTGANGAVTSAPATLTDVPNNSAVSFTITPAGSGTAAHPWYTLDTILLDSVAVANPPLNSDGITYTYTIPNVIKDQSVGVTFKKTQRTVIVSAYSNGTVTATPALAAGSVTVNDNDVVTLTFTPSPGYTLASINDSGVNLSLTVPYSAGLVKNVNNSWTYTTTVISNRTISPSFTNTLTVQATAGNGGTITPTFTTVSYGGSQTFTVTLADGYKVNQFKVNGVVKSLNAGNQYTETNVTSNLTASVTFTQYLYKITVNQPENGTISPSGAVYLDAGTSSFVITPDTGYKLTAVTDSNGEVAITGNNGEAYTYTTNPVSSSFTFSAAIALKSYTITMTAGTNGAVSANGVTAYASTTQGMTVSQGGAITFTAIPNLTYALSDIKVDGVSVKNEVINNTYTLTADRVTKNYSVVVSFEKLFVVTSSAGPNGTINPLGTTNLTETANTMEYTFTPSAGYSIEKVIYAGNDVTSGVVGNHYLLTAANPNQSIQVTFMLSQVNGMCGAANGTTVTTIPTSNLCAVGSASTLSSSLPWSWTCAGSNSGTNATCSASIQTYAVSLVSGGNGTLTGTTSQTVNHGSATAEVTAVSAAGYQFLNWTGTGGFITTTANPLTVYYVTSIQEITANFIKIPLRSGVVIPAPNKTEPGIEDALRILNIAAGKISLTQQDLDQGDVAPLVDGKPHGNGTIDTYDAIGVLRMVVGLL